MFTSDDFQNGFDLISGGEFLNHVSIVGVFGGQVKRKNRRPSTTKDLRLLPKLNYLVS